MIKGLTKEYIFQYKNNGETINCVVGVDEENDLCYLKCYTLDNKDRGDFDYISEFDDFDYLKVAFMFLPEEERKRTVEDVLDLFSEDILRTIQKIKKDQE